MICTLSMRVSERRFRISMSKPVLPNFDRSTHPVQLCRIAMTKRMKPHAPSIADFDTLK